LDRDDYFRPVMKVVEVEVAGFQLLELEWV
jgi:hypothetical protein